MARKVIVLGGTGMLGAMVADVLGAAPDVALVATRRRDDLGTFSGRALDWQPFDAGSAGLAECRAALAGMDWAINCIGMTKQVIVDADAANVEAAIRVNALFPHLLAAAAAAENVKVLQIATDCVYSGRTGDYDETSPHDPLDVYGKTKSLGEAASPHVFHVRSSIIGPEPKDHKFLLDWFVRQPRGAAVNGFLDHHWNGVTTLHFARIALAIVRGDLRLPAVQHLVPADRMTKAAMLEAFARSYGRGDIKIAPIATGTRVDRTLTTADASVNRTLWAAAGYAAPPAIATMIEELARFSPGCARTAA